MRPPSAVLLALILLGCRLDRGEVHTPPAGGHGSVRFDELLRWVPEGLESLLLYDPTCPMPARLHAEYSRYGTTWSVASDLRRVALTAGNFRPHGLGYGDWDGVFAITSCCVTVLPTEPLRFQLDVRSSDPAAALTGLAGRLTWNGRAVALDTRSATRAVLSVLDDAFPLSLDVLFGFNVQM